ncbi:hypothetical protein [Alloactinosynnema sp. L-07]|nr:hypothetical protein [Alloactinosynnema sp. L-07]
MRHGLRAVIGAASASAALGPHLWWRRSKLVDVVDLWIRRAGALPDRLGG